MGRQAEWKVRVKGQRRADAPSFQQTQLLEERLSEEAKRLRKEAASLRPGAARDDLIRRARQAETGSHMSEWLRSPGLQSPK